MTKIEQTEHQGAPMLGIAFADVAHMRCFMRSETSYYALSDHFSRDNFGAWLGAGEEGRGYRGISLQV